MQQQEKEEINRKLMENHQKINEELAKKKREKELVENEQKITEELPKQTREEELKEIIRNEGENYENHLENPHEKDLGIMGKDGTTMKNFALDQNKDANELKIKKSQDLQQQEKEEINRKLIENHQKITEEIAEKTREEELSLNSNINSSKVNTDENDKSKQQANRGLILLGFLVVGGITYYFSRSSAVKKNIKIEDEKHIENNELNNILEQ